MTEDFQEVLEDIEEKEVKVIEARMALVATQIINNVVVLYEFLPISEARAKVVEMRKNAL